MLNSRRACATGSIAVTLTQDVLAHALTLGFDIAGILPVGLPRYGAAFGDWLAAGFHGEMSYLAARAAERADPTLFAPDAQSMILVAASYAASNTGSGEEGTSSHPSSNSHPEPVEGCELDEGCAPAITQGRIARYACGPDYHDVIKPKLHAIDVFIRARTGREALGKVFVDTAPVLERDFAEQAGLGFIGRNCCLITPGLGSWTVLAGLMIPEALDEGRRTNDEDPQDTGDDALLVDHSSSVIRHSSVISHRASDRGCGRCTRCLDACPTRAFVAPHVLDPRRCISYLTIELRGPIPGELRPLMGNWVFGCDVCQEVCPYNKQVSAGQAGHSETPMPPGSMFCGKKRPYCHAEQVCHSTCVAANDQRSISGAGVSWERVDRDPVVMASDERRISLSDLLTLDDAGFRARFRGTPVLRAKRRGLVRNACIAAGNAGDPALVPVLVPLLDDAEPLIRGHAAWALGRIGGEVAVRALVRSFAVEGDPWVRDEITQAMP
jgi:epoxyqueuosine reductase